jgi:hypothetical protein
MANNADLLEFIFSKDNLDKDDVVNLLSGHQVKLGRGSTVHNLVTGKEIVGSKVKDIIEKWRSLKKIWESSKHGRSNIDLRFDPNADDLMVPRNYVLWWAWSKWKPTSTIWKGYSACLKHGLEQEWITPHDYVPQEETPEEPEPVKEKPEPGADELASRLRLIGVLSDMLQEDTIDPKNTKNANAIAAYIADNYGIDMPRKGLGKGTVVKVLGAAKKRLKEDGIN